MMLRSDLTVNLVHDIYRMPELFKFQILGLDVFRPILSLGPAFLFYLGELLTLAQTTILEIPSFDQLVFVQHLLKTNSTQQRIGMTEQTEGLIVKALKLVGAEMETPKMLGCVLGPCLVMIRIKAMQRKVHTSCGNNPIDGIFSLLPDGVTSLSMQNDELRSSGRAMKGIGLEVLMRIGLPLEERMHLFKKYLDLEIHRDMCPSHITWIKQSLMYLPADVELFDKPSSGSGDKSMQMLLNQIQGEIVDNTFSFMEYNSKESIGLHLAKSFLNSSFIALSEDIVTGQEMYNAAIKKNISNFVATVLSVDTVFTSKLLKSPDILRYQFVGYNEFLRVLQLFPREAFNLYIGQILSTGLSTFIQIPSSKILSLAASTFYPEVFLTKPFSLQVYSADSHPLPIFRDAESKLLYESAKADVEIEIAKKVLPEQYTDDGNQLPWRLVRYDIRKLETIVDHHFDFELDGHKRKYIQHAVSENKSHYEVYLIREIDGFKIPYDQVNAISLIALLRMGLLPVIKERFYGEFLSLPLYEDMAPWNIVFRGGRLEYIDYDTKDVTFNKMAPAAYQIMAMLMNFKRTVSDFGHCNDPAENQYGIELISHCVGSDFKGPCLDSRYPVPCADNTCKPTYIDCLKSLELLEQQYREKSYQSFPEDKRQSLAKWAFNHNGPVKRNS
ncbi:uncharacterized protein LOC121376378 isoform X2 [Gigantopelta aegis]|nr:uncharacterized protein LOC121376378 isoform X2 [Gigantopelta aegis]